MRAERQEQDIATAVGLTAAMWPVVERQVLALEGPKLHFGFQEAAAEHLKAATGWESAVSVGGSLPCGLRPPRLKEMSGQQ